MALKGESERTNEYKGENGRINENTDESERSETIFRYFFDKK